MAVCYLCDKVTRTFMQNLNDIKSKHTQTPIVVFLQQFLKAQISNRNMFDESNCICNICLSKIYSYDWACAKAKEQELDLRNMLLKTESLYDDCLISAEDRNFHRINEARGNGVLSSNDDDTKTQTPVCEVLVQIKTETKESTNFGVERVVKDERTDDIEVKPKVVPATKLTTSAETTPAKEPVKRSKPIIVRVVKRVPFLKSNPANASSPNVSVKSVSLPSVQPINKEPSKPIRTPSTKPSKMPSAKPNNKLKAPVEKQVVGKISHIDRIPVCKYCDGSFPNDKILQNHTKLHLKCYGSVTCHICCYQMSASDKEAFKEHVKKHTKVPPKQCVVCDEVATENFDLKFHVQNHHNEANLLCDLCGKTFVYSSALSKHRKSHIDERPEQCQYCPKAFKSKRSLKEHMDTHLNTEPAFSCAFCDKRFKRRDHQRVHERRHRDDTKKFKCTLCTAAFEYKHDFNLHLQRKHDAELPHDKSRK